MQSFDRELVDREISVVRLLTPPFEHTEPSPGYIQGYPPGIRENGGQYTHGAIWGIVAWCRLGTETRPSEALQYAESGQPHLTATEVRQYTGEPYAMAADVYPNPMGNRRLDLVYRSRRLDVPGRNRGILGLRRSGPSSTFVPASPVSGHSSRSATGTAGPVTLLPSKPVPQVQRGPGCRLMGRLFPGGKPKGLDLMWNCMTMVNCTTWW